MDKLLINTNTEEIFETRSAKIHRILREWIMKGEFKPGERLKQNDIAERLGVSRMPVREAIQQLVTEGLVNMEPHRGAIVKEFSKEEIKELYFLRAKLEPMALREAYVNLTSDDISKLLDLVERMIDFKDTAEFVELNIKFHKILIQKCPYNKLNFLIEGLWTGFPQLTPHLLPNQLEVSNQEHKELVVALKEDKIELACEILETHIKRAYKNITETF